MGRLTRLPDFGIFFLINLVILVIMILGCHKKNSSIVGGLAAMNLLVFRNARVDTDRIDIMNLTLSFGQLISVHREAGRTHTSCFSPRLGGQNGPQDLLRHLPLVKERLGPDVTVDLMEATTL